MLRAVDLLPVSDTPVTLLTRHSIREMVSGQGLAGYNLQLTPQGRDLAESWGAYLVEQTDRNIQHCMSSPIQRCVDTAALMIQGADCMTASDIAVPLTIVQQHDRVVSPVVQAVGRKHVLVRLVQKGISHSQALHFDHLPGRELHQVLASLR